MDADAINVDGNEVTVPEDVAASLRTNLRSFSPVNQNYVLLEPVRLSPKAPPPRGEPAGMPQGFGVIVNQSGQEDRLRDGRADLGLTHDGLPFARTTSLRGRRGVGGTASAGWPTRRMACG